MLVLTRRIGEEVVIGDDICITVTAVQGNKVRLGITAPTSIPVMRPELLSRHAPSAPKEVDRSRRNRQSCFRTQE